MQILRQFRIQNAYSFVLSVVATVFADAAYSPRIGISAVVEKPHAAHSTGLLFSGGLAKFHYCDLIVRVLGRKKSQTWGELSCPALPVALPFCLTELRKVGA